MNINLDIRPDSLENHFDMELRSFVQDKIWRVSHNKKLDIETSIFVHVHQPAAFQTSMLRYEQVGELF